MDEPGQSATEDSRPSRTGGTGGPPGNLPPALVFRGRIAAGIGRHAELVVPGRGALDQAPADWPDVLFPGSLNIRIPAKGFPAHFEALGLPCLLTSLDRDCFPAAFTIPFERFANNRLVPLPDHPRRGTGQVWRTTLEARGRTIACWTLRRYGSGRTDALELLSGEGLRARYGLADGDRATVTLHAG